MANLIEITNLSVGYPGRKLPTLQDVSLSVTAGETVLLLGASGCGKSTLALTLNGLIPHSIGSITAGSVHVDSLDTQATAVAALAQRVGIVFQDPEAQFVTLTVEDELLFGLENLCLPPAQMDGRVETALAQVGMAAYRRHPVDRLSGGQKQRIALAALLALEPQLLLFDEPTANLDPVGTQDVFRLIAERKAQGQNTIILIEHKLDELIHLVDRVVVLGFQGAILADGPPRSVFRDDGPTLIDHGIWMPQVCLLAHQLRAQGLALDPFPVTLDEAEQVLRDVPGALATHGAPPPILQTDSEQVASPQAAPALEVRNLSFRYGAQQVLSDISLRVPQGDFLALVGANGAGKTTLAQHLVGILAAPPGTVWLHGQDLRRMRARDLAKQIGYVFQNPEHQFVTASVFEEVAYGLRVLGHAEASVTVQAEALLARFGLERYARANPFTLSHGEKRRLSVATMLAMGQQTLILDEPTFGQDQRNAEAIMALLRDLHSEGRTIIIITHDMALVAEHAAHVAVMNAGRLLFHGDTRVAFAQPELLRQAHLTPPPIAQLAARLAWQQPGWAGLCTIADATRRLVSLLDEEVSCSEPQIP
ncbi:MAG: energy-coupling factor transporter ATPase [Chloroflexaceae bacterium]|jgi:energy-coupling factor transport system ATP-binding protein|nr:energy-coupling factor transporter ATPase [Chloroflexaceae bacterium]